MYHIENTINDHTNLLKQTVTHWGDLQPDMYLVSREGVKVYTQRILLSFYSKTLCQVLQDGKEDLAGVSVQASSSSLTMMLKVLVSGSVIANKKADLLEMEQTAEDLGIVLDSTQIGYRKKNLGQKQQPVSVDSEKVSTKDTEIEKISLHQIKTEPYDDVSLVSLEKPSLIPIKEKKKKRISNEGPKPLRDDNACDQCGKSFLSKEGLKFHANVHKEDKPYKCDVCEKGFSAPASLKNHKLLHTGEVFKCEFCDYTAVQKGNLKSHRIKIHKTSIETEKELASQVTGSSKEKEADDVKEVKDNDEEAVSIDKTKSQSPSENNI